MLSTNSTGVLSRLIRFFFVFWYAVYFPGLVGRRPRVTSQLLYVAFTFKLDMAEPSV